MDRRDNRRNTPTERAQTQVVTARVLSRKEGLCDGKAAVVLNFLTREPPLRHTTAATSQAGYPLSPRVSCSSLRRARLLRLPPASLLHRSSCVCGAARGNLARAAVFTRDAPLLWRSARRGILLELTGFPRSGETYK